MARRTRKARRKTRRPSRRRMLVERLYKTGQFFAIVFMMLLIVAAIALAKGDERDANQAARYAYYSLVISVIVLLVATALEEKREMGLEEARRTVAAEKGSKAPSS